MGFYKNWTTQAERDSKKGYIAVSRRLVKRMITAKWLDKPP